MKQTNQKTIPKECISPSVNPQTICYVQITRIGDILQTIQAAQMFKNQFPDVKNILIARKQFAESLTFLNKNIFDEIHLFSGENFFPNENVTIEEGKINLNNFLREINNKNISVVINFSFSKSSSYLCSLIKSKHKMGLAANTYQQITIPDKWSQYVYSTVMSGPLNPFSLVDIYRCMLGTTEHATIEHITQKQQINKIVIHPFSSHSKKMWKQTKWVEVIYQILKKYDQIEIFVVGDKSEIKLSNSIFESPLIAQYKDRAHSTVGTSSIMELYQLLESSDLFIGHDSMVGHLAALAKVQTVTISLGTTRPSETTPYGENNYNIMPKTSCFPCFPDSQCDFYQCHTDIPYQAIISCIHEIIEEGAITKKYQESKNSCFHLNSVSIYKSKFTSASFIQLHDILSDYQSINNIFLLYYRICWQYLLNDIEEPQLFPELNTTTHKQLLHYINGLQYFYELCEFGQKYSKYILEEISSKVPRIEKIKDYSFKIDEIDELQKLIKKSYPHLSPLIDFLTVQKGNLKGNNIVELTENSYLLYHEAANISNVINELIEKTIAEHKLKTKIKTTRKEFDPNR